MMVRLRDSLRHDKDVLPALMMAVILLSLPNLLTAFWPRLSEEQAEVFWTGAGVILLPCVFSVPVRTTLRLWLPFVFFLPAVMIYSVIAGFPLREWAFVVFMETDWHELERFRYGAVAALLLGPPALWIFHRFISRHVAAGRRLSWASRVLTMCFVLIVPTTQILKSGWEIGALVTEREMSAAFPAGLAISALSAWKIRHDLGERRNLAQNITVQSRSNAPREIDVLVIGESARFGSFQINGYSRETTPRLAKIPGLLSFQDVAAPATVTLMSVPMLITPATEHRFSSAASLPSVVGLFRRAGFRTAWLSTQMKHGMYDTALSIFSKDADEARFLSGEFAPGGGVYATAYDGDLIQPMRDLLARGDPKLLIVLHTMGSHQHYGDRFPPDFNRFASYPMPSEGSLFHHTFSAEEKRNLTNAYDNSILYTDWVLSQLIEALAATHALSTLYYVSDHGQNMGDAPVLAFAHGVMTKDVLHVPLIVWLSPEYRAQRPTQTAALESHLKTPFSADTTFHTLLDMAALDCPLLDHQHSAASRDFHPGPRMVRDLQGDLVDYDEFVKNTPPTGKN